MPRVVRTEKELANAVKEDKDTIIVEGDLKNEVIRIKAKGSVAWGVCIACLTVALVSILAAPETGGTSLAVSGFTGTDAASILGVSTASTAVLIAVAAGGVGVLNKLRKYNINTKNGYCILIK